MREPRDGGVCELRLPLRASSNSIVALPNVMQNVTEPSSAPARENVPSPLTFNTPTLTLQFPV